jgi:hypothetical protein
MCPFEPLLFCPPLYLCTAAQRHSTTCPAVNSQHSEQVVSRRETLLQLSSTAVLGSLGVVLGSLNLLTRTQPAWAAGEPRELAGAVKEAVDQALDKFVVKAKVGHSCMNARMCATACGFSLCLLCV